MNIGTARSEYPVICEKAIFPAMFESRLQPSKKKIPTNPEKSKQMKIGVPISNRKNKTKRQIMIAIVGLTIINLLLLL
jgi:hypothetical protein